MVHLEESRDSQIKKPIIKIILDHNEEEPQDMEKVRNLFYDAALSLPRRVEQLDIIRLKTKH